MSRFAIGAMLKYWFWIWPILATLMAVWAWAEPDVWAGNPQVVWIGPLIGTSAAGWAWMRTGDRRYLGPFLASASLLVLITRYSMVRSAARVFGSPVDLLGPFEHTESRFLGFPHELRPLSVLVPQSQVLQFPGCQDQRLLKRVLSKCKPRLAELDEEMDFDEDEEGDISHEQALRELFSGAISSPNYGERYSWAFDALCESLGTWQSNQGFSPCNIDWYDQLDEQFLSKTGAVVRFTFLITRSPIAIPLSDDWQ